MNRAKPVDATELMRRAIDLPEGRRLYGKRIGMVAPVFANLRHNKRLSRFTLRGRFKVRVLRLLYCLVNSVEASRMLKEAGLGSLWGQLKTAGTVRSNSEGFVGSSSVPDSASVDSVVAGPLS